MTRRAFILSISSLVCVNALRLQGRPPTDLEHDMCLGDVCISENARTLRQSFESTLAPLESFQRVYMEEVIPSNQRTLLLELCHPFHGSTALFSLLMSSPKVSTLCGSRTWQCEGRVLMQRHGYNISSFHWNWEDTLQYYSEHWNLSKPVLVDKSPMTVHGVHFVNPAIKAAALPPLIRAEGIEKMNPAYVMMWRPLCLSKASGRYQKKLEAGLNETQRLVFEKNELQLYEDLVVSHQGLMRQKAKIVVLNLADLIWRPKSTALRLHQHLPVLGMLDPEFEPQLGRDIYPENHWKVNVSVAEFGRRLDPGAMQYSVEESACQGSTSGFEELKGDELLRASKALEYLRLVSHMD